MPESHVSQGGTFERVWAYFTGASISCISATIHPDIKRTLVAMSERTGMSVSQVTDEVLYTGLIEMQELPELDE